MTLKLTPKRTERERKAKRKEQVGAALRWQAAIRERRALEETLLLYEGAAVKSYPLVGRNGKREKVPAVLFAADQLAEAIGVEVKAAEEFRATLD